MRKSDKRRSNKQKRVERNQEAQEGLKNAKANNTVL